MKLSIIKSIVIICILAVAVLLVVIYQRAGSRTLTLYYSTLQIEMDVKGNLHFKKNEGNSIVVDGTVTGVRLKLKSKSVAIESDIAYFSLDSAQSIPGHSEFDTIKLKFDQYGLKDRNRFINGEKWRFTFAENGTLVNLEPIVGR